MELESLRIGDRVRTVSGEAGTIVHLSKLTVFVRLDGKSDDASLIAYLASQLTRIDPAEAEGSESKGNGRELPSE
jgi:hypothetical protein